MAITVDDCMVAVNPKAIDWLMTKIENKFKIKRGGRLRKHLGINYDWKEEDNEIFVEIRMDSKISNIIESYEKLTNKVCRIRKTSAS